MISRSLPIFTATIWFFVATSGYSLAGGQANAGVGCNPLFGRFESRVVDPSDPDACTSPIGFCTDGTVIGGLRGTFRLTVETFIFVSELSSRTDPLELMPFAFIVGESVIQVKDDDDDDDDDDRLTGGSTLTGIDTGALDTVEGQIATLLTFTEGTGTFEGASGHIVISGVADEATGINIGEYRGEVCTPTRDD